MLLRNIISILFSVILSAGFSLLLNMFSPIQSSYWPVGIIFFSIICFPLNIYYTSQALKENFTGTIMAGIVIRLLLSLILIVLFKFYDGGGFFNFAIHFILHYIIFTIFEIIYLLRIIKNQTTGKIN
jgi:hypothetical protein